MMPEEIAAPPEIDVAVPSRRARRALARKAMRVIVLALILGLIVHLLLPQLATLGRSWRVLREMPYGLVILAALAQLVSLVSNGLLLRQGVAVVGQRLSLTSGALIALAANSVSLLAGGLVASTAGTFRWLKQHGVDAAGAGLAGLLPLLLNNLLLLVLALIGFGRLLLTGRLTRLESVGVGVGVALLVGALLIGIWGRRNRPILLQLVHRLGQRWSRRRQRPFSPARVETFVAESYRIWDQLQGGGWRGPTLGAALSVFFNMISLFILFQAAGFPINLGVLLAGYGPALLLGKISLTPGGLGVVEGAMTAIYTTLAVPNDVTVVVILTYRALTFWAPALIGFIAFFYLRHRVSAARPDYHTPATPTS